MSDSQIGHAPITCIALPPYSSVMSDRRSDWELVMRRNRRWLERWGSFLMGICIGLLIVTPVLAMPQSGLPALLPNQSVLAADECQSAS
jgi:hypothetical protein